MIRKFLKCELFVSCAYITYTQESSCYVFLLLGKSLIEDIKTRMITISTSYPGEHQAMSSIDEVHHTLACLLNNDLTVSECRPLQLLQTTQPCGQNLVFHGLFVHFYADESNWSSPLLYNIQHGPTMCPTTPRSQFNI